jgi:hypothetical protein
VRPTLLRSLADVAELLDEPRTAREVWEALGLDQQTANERLNLLEALGRAVKVDRVRQRRQGPMAARWRRMK